MLGKVWGNVSQVAKVALARLSAQSASPVAPPDATRPQPSLAERRAGSDPGWLKVLPAATLLANDGKTLSQIYIQSQQSEAAFQRDLLPAINQYAAFVQLMPASESHHHAHVGGLLAHTLEVIVAALKLRNGQLLPRNATAEDIARTRAAWSYAVFFGALLHDIGKVLTDLRIEGRDATRATRRWVPLAGSLEASGFTEYRVAFAPRAERDYQAHKKLPIALLLAMVPAPALAFLGREPKIYGELIAFLSAEESVEKGALAQIVRRADQHSTAQNLATGSRERFASATHLPLVERMMDALRALLAQGTRLPLNRDGAAGWVFDGAIWFVAKRVADEVRAELLRADPEDPGVPGATKNDRLFDTWQDYRVIEVNPETKQAIWYVRLEGDGYTHCFSMLKFPLNRIWTDPAGYPAAMGGQIVPVPREDAKADSASEGEPIETNAPVAEPIPPSVQQPSGPAARIDEPDELADSPAPSMPMAPPLPPLPPSPPSPSLSSAQRKPQSVPPPRAANAVRKPVDAPATAAGVPVPTAPRVAPPKSKPTGGILRQSVPEPAYSAARSPASGPAADASPEATVKAPAPNPPNAEQRDSDLLDEGDAAPAAGAAPVRRTRRPNGMGGAPVQAFAVPPKMAADAEPDPVAMQFMTWLQQGIADGAIKYNEAGAPVHFVKEGMALVTPRIFRDYASQCCEAATDGMTVQRLVIRARWNVVGPENSNILNYAVIGRGGKRVGKLAAVVLRYPERWVKPVPVDNLALVRYVDSMAPV